MRCPAVVASSVLGRPVRRSSRASTAFPMTSRWPAPVRSSTSAARCGSARGRSGTKGQNFYNALVRRYGYEAEAAEIQDLYLSGKKEEAAKAVPAELLELTNLCGPEGYIKERLAAFKDAGVTVLNVMPIGADVPD